MKHINKQELVSSRRDRYYVTIANLIIHAILYLTGIISLIAAIATIAAFLFLLLCAYISARKRDYFSIAVIITMGSIGPIVAALDFNMIKFGEHITVHALWTAAMLSEATHKRVMMILSMHITNWGIFWFCNYSNISPLQTCDINEFSLWARNTMIFLGSLGLTAANCNGLVYYRNGAINSLQKSNEELETSLQKKEKLATELSDLLTLREDFLLKFSHELRNPLNAIIGNIELALLEKLPLELHDIIMSIRVSGEQLLSIINNILDSGKLEISPLDINPLPCKLSDYLVPFWAIASMMIKSKKLFGSLEVEHKCPEHLLLDKSRVTQILMNLLSNSLKFTNRGKITIRVSFHEKEELDDSLFEPDLLDKSTSIIKRMEEVKRSSSGGTIAKPDTHRSPKDNTIFLLTLKKKTLRNNENLTLLRESINGFLKIEVKDTGCGLTNEQAKGLFQKFSQVGEHSAGRKIGTGLGLWISRELCNTMGGDIRVKSSTKQGTSFMACIRVRTYDSQSIVFTRSQSQVITSSKICSGSLTGVEQIATSRRIMIVDDLEYNREVHQKLLQKAGASGFFLAENGKEALEEFQSKPQGYYDMILMDLDMPVMDGEEASEKIRKFEEENGREKVRIVILTGHAIEQKRVKCLDPEGKIQANMFLVKPITVAGLNSLFTDTNSIIEYQKELDIQSV